MRITTMRLAGAAVIGVLAAVSPTAASAAGAATPGSEQVRADSGARSVWMTIHNNTSCGLELVESGLDHGEWSNWAGVTSPAPYVYRNNTAQMGAEAASPSLFTGTEGHATYRTYGCYDGAKNNRVVRLYWDNPYVGSNSYNTDGTDVAFAASHTGGSGDVAYVDYWVQDR
ncbi:aegerolysin family protein [Streptomyces sp. NPDC006692]|uniref:aegerolysin family protein n=1 Tax=unclassified Streptomyces TaxID=2593676 RepID=UPI0036B96A8C